MRDAVLENELRSAVSKAQTLESIADLSVAQAALSAQLVELEALQRRAPDDARPRALLAAGYDLLAQGFVEVRRLEGVAAGDSALAANERELQEDALARARFFAGPGQPGPDLFGRQLEPATRACSRRDRAGYEQALSRVLASAAPGPEQRLRHALAKRVAAQWLMPNVAARCGFASASPGAPLATGAGSRH